MFNRLIAVIAISATSGVVHLYKENRQLRKEGEYFRLKSIAFAKMLSTTGETLIYTMDMLDKNGIEFNEFDKVVFDTQMREVLEELAE